MEYGREGISGRGVGGTELRREALRASGHLAEGRGTAKTLGN